MVTDVIPVYQLLKSYSLDTLFVNTVNPYKYTGVYA